MNRDLLFQLWASVTLTEDLGLPVPQQSSASLQLEYWLLSQLLHRHFIPLLWSGSHSHLQKGQQEADPMFYDDSGLTMSVKSLTKKLITTPPSGFSLLRRLTVRSRQLNQFISRNCASSYYSHPTDCDFYSSLLVLHYRLVRSVCIAIKVLGCSDQQPWLPHHSFFTDQNCDTRDLKITLALLELLAVLEPAQSPAMLSAFAKAFSFSFEPRPQRQLDCRGMHVFVPSIISARIASSLQSPSFLNQRRGFIFYLATNVWMHLPPLSRLEFLTLLATEICSISPSHRVSKAFPLLTDETVTDFCQVIFGCAIDCLKSDATGSISPWCQLLQLWMQILDLIEDQHTTLLWASPLLALLKKRLLLIFEAFFSPSSTEDRHLIDEFHTLAQKICFHYEALMNTLKRRNADTSNDTASKNLLKASRQLVPTLRMHVTSFTAQLSRYATSYNVGEYRDAREKAVALPSEDDFSSGLSSSDEEAENDEDQYASHFFMQPQAVSPLRRVSAEIDPSATNHIVWQG